MRRLTPPAVLLLPTALLSHLLCFSSLVLPLLSRDLLLVLQPLREGMGVSCVRLWCCRARVLRGVKFLLQLLLSIFGVFYLESAMRRNAALPLLRMARTPQRSLAAAAAAAAAPSSPDSTLSEEQQHALCLLGCYCLSICSYAAFIGVALEAAAARRAAMRRVAAAALPAAVAVSAAVASAAPPATAAAAQAKRSRRCSVAEWLQHALLPGLVIPLVVESLSFCKSGSSSRNNRVQHPTGGLADATVAEGSADSDSNSNGNSSSSNGQNPFACNASLLLAAPLATSLAESLLCLRQEQMQLQTESVQIHTWLPLVLLLRRLLRGLLCPPLLRGVCGCADEAKVFVAALCVVAANTGCLCCLCSNLLRLSPSPCC